jgi:hypothetical protein
LNQWIKGGSVAQVQRRPSDAAGLGLERTILKNGSKRFKLVLWALIDQSHLGYLK